MNPYQSPSAEQLPHENTVFNYLWATFAWMCVAVTFTISCWCLLFPKHPGLLFAGILGFASYGTIIFLGIKKVIQNHAWWE